jgi:hypothetical protein
VDDTAANDQEDTLVEMAFHVPPTSAEYPATEEGEPPAKVGGWAGRSCWAAGSCGRGLLHGAEPLAGSRSRERHRTATAAAAGAAVLAPLDCRSQLRRCASAAASPAQVLAEQVLALTDAGGAAAEEAVCVLDDVAILAPRGRFSVEMHLAFLKLGGQTQDFKIR